MNGGLNCFAKVILSTLRLIWICQRQHIGTLGKIQIQENKKTVLSVSSGLDCNLSLDNKATPTTTLLLSLAAKILFFSYSDFHCVLYLLYIKIHFQTSYMKIDTPNNKQQEWNVSEEKEVVMEVRSAIRWLPLCGPESDWRCARKECLPAINEETWVSILHPPPPARFLILPRCSTTSGMEMWSQFPL